MILAIFSAWRYIDVCIRQLVTALLLLVIDLSDYIQAYSHWDYCKTSDLIGQGYLYLLKTIIVLLLY